MASNADGVSRCIGPAGPPPPARSTARLSREDPYVNAPWRRRDDESDSDDEGPPLGGSLNYMGAEPRKREDPRPGAPEVREAWLLWCEVRLGEVWVHARRERRCPPDEGWTCYGGEVAPHEPDCATALARCLHEQLDLARPQLDAVEKLLKSARNGHQCVWWEADGPVRRTEVWAIELQGQLGARQDYGTPVAPSGDGSRDDAGMGTTTGIGLYEAVTMPLREFAEKIRKQKGGCMAAAGEALVMAARTAVRMEALEGPVYEWQEDGQAQDGSSAPDPNGESGHGGGKSPSGADAEESPLLMDPKRRVRRCSPRAAPMGRTAAAAAALTRANEGATAGQPLTGWHRGHTSLVTYSCICGPGSWGMASTRTRGRDQYNAL